MRYSAAVYTYSPSTCKTHKSKAMSCNAKQHNTVQRNARQGIAVQRNANQSKAVQPKVKQTKYYKGIAEETNNSRCPNYSTYLNMPKPCEAWECLHTQGSTKLDLFIASMSAVLRFYVHVFTGSMQIKEINGMEATM